MRPPMKKVAYTVSKKVEIVSNEEGFFGSFYQATIVSCLDNGKYVVRYKNLMEDDSSKKPLTETKFPNEIRPLPPRVKVDELQYGQMVDAFDNDGWWLGKIIGKFPDAEYEWQYNVYFHTTNEEVLYPANRVRIHHDWVSGRWIKS